MYQLYSYYRSSCSYRVRIAMNLKRIPFKTIPIDLLTGEQRSPAYLQINPQGLVPSLVDPDSHETFTQSLAIIEYMDEKFPHAPYPLLGGSPAERAHIRSLAQMIACDIQPVLNLKVLNYIKENFTSDEKAKLSFIRHFMQDGLDAYERRLENTSGLYSFGDHITLADVCLVPQVYNARRYEVDLSLYPLIKRIDDKLNKMEEFMLARPEQNQSLHDRR